MSHKIGILLLASTAMVAPAVAQNGPVHVVVDGVDPYVFQRTTVPAKILNYW